VCASNIASLVSESEPERTMKLVDWLQAIARRVARSLGGRHIDVSDVSGTGAQRFWHFHCSADAHGRTSKVGNSGAQEGPATRTDGAAQSNGCAAPGPHDKPRVLLAEDEPLTRALLQDWLTERDFDVIAFEDGSQARSFLSAFAERGAWPVIDLVFTDLAMPELGGIELLRYIHSVRPQTPVVLMTAFADLGSRAEASELGAAAYLEKPIDLEQLTAVTMAVLQAPGARDCGPGWRESKEVRV